MWLPHSDKVTCQAGPGILSLEMQMGACAQTPSIVSIDCNSAARVDWGKERSCDWSIGTDK